MQSSNDKTVEFLSAVVCDRLQLPFFTFFSTTVVAAAYASCNHLDKTSTCFQIHSPQFNQQIFNEIKAACDSIKANTFSQSAIKQFFHTIKLQHRNLDHVVFKVYTSQLEEMNGDLDIRHAVTPYMILHQLLKSVLYFCAEHFSRIPCLLDIRCTPDQRAARIQEAWALIRNAIEKALRACVIPKMLESSQLSPAAVDHADRSRRTCHSSTSQKQEDTLLKLQTEYNLMRNKVDLLTTQLQRMLEPAPPIANRPTTHPKYGPLRPQQPSPTQWDPSWDSSWNQSQSITGLSPREIQPANHSASDPADHSTTPSIQPIIPSIHPTTHSHTKPLSSTPQMSNNNAMDNNNPASWPASIPSFFQGPSVANTLSTPEQRTLHSISQAPTSQPPLINPHPTLDSTADGSTGNTVNESWFEKSEE